MCGCAIDREIWELENRRGPWFVVRQECLKITMHNTEPSCSPSARQDKEWQRRELKHDGKDHDGGDGFIVE